MDGFWLGFLALPLGAAAIGSAWWVLVLVWDRIDQWARARAVRRLREVVHIDASTGREFLSVAPRAPLLVALAQTPRLWSWRPLPGWLVIVARDYTGTTPEQREHHQRAVDLLRAALGDAPLPVDERGDR